MFLSEQPSASIDIAAQMDAAAAEMVTRVALCMALEEDESLQRSLANAPTSDQGAGTLFVQLPASAIWLQLDSDRPMQILRDLPAGTCNAVSANGLPQHREQLWREMIHAAWRTGAHDKARKLLSPVLTHGMAPTGRQMKDILRWAPVIELYAYQHFTHGSMLLDNARRPILDGERPIAVRDALLTEYWGVLHTMGHMLTVASTRGATPWLSELAASFSWSTWSPTFVLSRERTLWLVAAAAKSAVAFGEAVIDRYLNKLSRADHPLKELDALLGLVSIGLDGPEIGRYLVTVLEAIDRAADDTSSRSEYFPELLQSAIAVLRDPEQATRRFLRFVEHEANPKSKSPRLFGLDALRSDPATMLSSGHCLGLLALPTIVGSDPSEYYPRHGSPGFLIRPRDVLQILRRAWNSRSPLKDRRILH